MTHDAISDQVKEMFYRRVCMYVYIYIVVYIYIYIYTLSTYYVWRDIVYTLYEVYTIYYVLRSTYYVLHTRSCYVSLYYTTIN